MKRDDLEILHDIQKNTRKAMTVIDVVLDKTVDDKLCIELSEHALEYAKIHNRAIEELLRNQGEVYRGNSLEEIAIKGGIHADTIFNISTPHLAGLMIRKSSEGLTDIWKTIRHHQRAGELCMEMAEELADFEEQNIQKYKEFL